MVLDLSEIKNLMTTQGLSQAELARLSGISRSRLNVLLSDKPTHVRERTLLRLTAALAQSRRACDDDGALILHYKRLMTKEFAELDCRGFGIPYVAKLPLEALYVPLYSRQTFRWTGRACPEGEKPGLTRQGTSQGRALPTQECLRRFDRLLLLGDPGSGKTTLLRHIARSFARNSQTEDGYSPAPLLPLFVSLAKLAQAQSNTQENDKTLDPAGLLAAWLRAADRTEKPPEQDAEKILRACLEEGTCIVLLDGLDEVSEGSVLFRSLTSFIERYPRNRFVLTSRLIGFEEEPWCRLGFTAFTLEEWTAGQIREFARKWVATKHGHIPNKKCAKCQEEAKQLWEAIDAHSGVKAIATNPLLLTILASLHHARIVFPRRRVELYERVVDARLETWERAKQAARPGDLVHNLALDGREYGWLLSALALRMQELDLTLAQRWWLADFIQQFLRNPLGFEPTDAKKATDRIILYLTERSGLLVERGADLFGFSHLTFQEYFASRGLLEDAPGGGRGLLSRLRLYLFHPRWREVIRLLAAKLTPVQAPEFFRALLDDADPLGRFLRRGPILALQCLADGTPLPDRVILDDLFGGLTSLGISRWIGITFRVLWALRSLRGTRLERRAVEVATGMIAEAESSLDEDELAYLKQADTSALVEATRSALKDAPDSVGHVVNLPKFGICLVRAGASEELCGKLLEQLRDDKTENSLKLVLVEQLGGQLGQCDVARNGLLESLETNKSAEVRARSACELARIAKTDEAVAEALKRGFEIDPCNAVRAACAISLRELVPTQPSLRDAFAALVDSRADGEIRGGCVYALGTIADSDTDILKRLLDRLQALDEETDVRAQCIWALQHLLGRDKNVTDLVIALLQQEGASALQRVSAQALAEALSEHQIAWSEELVHPVEGVLMNLPNPCPHALEALVALADAKELHGGFRMESVLRKTLKPFRKQIEIAFVFGSTARYAQNADSDIDVCLIGQVGLKELSLPLEAVEHTLGRRVSPVIYSPDVFRSKVAAGDPFLLDMSRREKLFLKGSDDEFRTMVADRRLVAP